MRHPISLVFFVCGVARVAVSAVFTTIAFVDPSTGIILAGPFGLLVTLTAVYDARARHRRKPR